MYWFVRVVFGVFLSFFLLNVIICYYLFFVDIFREFVERILKSLYVDDFVSGDDFDNLVFEMYENLKLFFKNGGFNMWKWVFNFKVL